jgi:5-methylcytosine-specific restriction enzyme B
MARSPEATPVLDAAEHWRDRCLLDEGSVFTDEPIWTATAVEGLVTHYVGNLDVDVGGGDFFQKLEKQMAAAPPESVRLAAELLWVMYLIVSSRAASGATKRLQIRKVFAWSGEKIPEDHWALGEVLDTGVAHPGTAYNTHRWRELVFFIQMLERWMALPRADRQELLADPWDFAKWIRQVEGAARRQLPHVLCYLLFPDSFEAITGRTHKKEIVQAFRDLIDTDREVDYTDNTALDRAVLQVRDKLSAEYGEELHFYQTKAVAERWREEKTGTDGDGAARDQTPTEAEAWLQKELGPGRVWLLAAGGGGRLWTDFEREGIAAIGWDHLGDLSAFSSREEIQAEIASVSGKENPTNDSLACWEFGHVIKPGDVILAKKGASTLLAQKNLILQGPPGVGKTFIAKRIAWTLIGRKDSAPLQMVQFHQSYSYEDFIQGWRPTESGGFKLRNGVFHEFCSRAEKALDVPHFFIIDEINRGNLSRIFGELMMLIEADKRGPEFAIPLTYSQSASGSPYPPTSTSWG